MPVLQCIAISYIICGTAVWASQGNELGELENHNQATCQPGATNYTRQLIYATTSLQTVRMSFLAHTSSCLKIIIIPIECKSRYWTVYKGHQMNVTTYHMKTEVDCCPGYSMQNGFCIKIDNLAVTSDGTESDITVYIAAAATGVAVVVIITTIVTCVCCFKRCQGNREAEPDVKMSNMSECRNEETEDDTYLTLDDTRGNTQSYLGPPCYDSAKGGVNEYKTEKIYIAGEKEHRVEGAECSKPGICNVYDSISDDE